MFESSKASAIFCSTKCRMRWARKRKAIKENKDRALRAIRALAQLSKQNAEFTDEINTAFDEIRAWALDGLRLRPDSEQLAKLDMLNERSRRRA